MRPKLVILDRDDTLVRVPKGRKYLFGDDPIIFMPGAAQALRHLRRRGVPVVVASNQQGVALREFPLITAQTVALFNQRLGQEVNRLGGAINHFYICPHSQSDNCDCRKPKPGMLLEALRDYHLQPEQAISIGNSLRDEQAALAAGIRAVLVPASQDAALPREAEAYYTLLHAVRAALGGSGKCGRVKPTTLG